MSTETVPKSVFDDSQKEMAKLALENKTLQQKVTSATDAVKAATEKLAAAGVAPPYTNPNSFAVPGGNWIEALQHQATTAAELQPTDNYRQVADKTFKLHKITCLTNTQWMAASSFVFLQPFAYPKILAEGDPHVAAGFIVSGLRAEFSTVSPDLCGDLCSVIMGMAATVADYVATKKSPQAQMELLMASLTSCQRKIEMLQDRRASRGNNNRGGGGRSGNRGNNNRGGGGRSGNRYQKRFAQRTDEEPEAEAEPGGRGGARGRGGGRGKATRRIR